MSIWHNGHSLLIVPVIFYLIYEELKKHQALPPGANGWGFAVFLPTLLLHILDTGIHSMLLSSLSLYLVLPGLSLLFLGTKRTRAILFPMMMFLLTLPIPLFLTESIQLALRHISTWGAEILLRIFQMPVFVQGTTLEIANGSLQVAYACSGFSTLYASITIACIVAYLSPDVRRGMLVLVLATPVAIGANIIRIFLLCVMVSWFGIDILKTSLHEISGMLTFAISIPLIILIGRHSAPAEPGQT